jgi:hypothetical protein
MRLQLCKEIVCSILYSTHRVAFTASSSFAFQANREFLRPRGADGRWSKGTTEFPDRELINFSR